MDPTSAGVAVVGLAASLVTLVTLVSESSKKFHSLCKQISDAPEDVKQLLGKMRTLEFLSQKLVEHSRNGEVPNEMLEFWRHRAELMTDDVKDMKESTDSLENWVQRKTYSQKQVRMRIAKFFADDKIKAFERKLSQHVEAFTLALTLVST
jgi:dsDNA-specific endonuclease/ATPase MutS2